MTETTDPFAAEAKKMGPTAEQQRALGKLVEELVETQAALEIATLSVSDLTNCVQDLVRKRIPEVMTEAGVTNWGTKDVQVTLRDGFEASLPAASTIDKAKGTKREELLDRMRRGYAWLREHGAGDLIKRQLAVQLGKGQDEAATELAERLRAEGFPVLDAETVHPATLKKFLADESSAGVDVPKDVFGVHRYTYAAVKKLT